MGRAWEAYGDDDEDDNDGVDDDDDVNNDDDDDDDDGDDDDDDDDDDDHDNVMVWVGFTVSIDYFRIPHNTLCLPPKFCITYCLKMLLGKCRSRKLPGAFKNNGLCRIWGANRVYYGEFENREYRRNVGSTLFLTSYLSESAQTPHHCIL